MTKGTLGLTILGMTSLYACQQGGGEGSQTDAETADSTELGGNNTPVGTATDAYGMDTLKGTENTRGMDEVGTTSGTGAAGTTYGGDTDTTSQTGGTSSQSGLENEDQSSGSNQ